MDKIDQKQRFLDNNIPYNEIDAEMIDIIDVLNFKLGYKTKFCCYGHRKCEMSSIMFDTCVNDKMIYKLEVEKKDCLKGEEYIAFDIESLDE